MTTPRPPDAESTNAPPALGPVPAAAPAAAPPEGPPEYLRLLPLGAKRQADDWYYGGEGWQRQPKPCIGAPLQTYSHPHFRPVPPPGPVPMCPKCWHAVACRWQHGGPDPKTTCPACGQTFEAQPSAARQPEDGEAAAGQPLAPAAAEPCPVCPGIKDGATKTAATMPGESFTLQCPECRTDHTARVSRLVTQSEPAPATAAPPSSAAPPEGPPEYLRLLPLGAKRQADDWYYGGEGWQRQPKPCIGAPLQTYSHPHFRPVPPPGPVPMCPKCWHAVACRWQHGGPDPKTTCPACGQTFEAQPSAARQPEDGEAAAGQPLAPAAAEPCPVCPGIKDGATKTAATMPGESFTLQCPECRTDHTARVSRLVTQSEPAPATAAPPSSAAPPEGPPEYLRLLPLGTERQPGDWWYMPKTTRQWRQMDATDKVKPIDKNMLPHFRPVPPPPAEREPDGWVGKEQVSRRPWAAGQVTLFDPSAFPGDAGATPTADYVPVYFGEPPPACDNTGEKDRRVYYQAIVYAVCAALDRFDGKRGAMGIRCGTLSTPSTQVQERVTALVAEVAELKTQPPPAQTSGPVPMCPKCWGAVDYMTKIALGSAQCPACGQTVEANPEPAAEPESSEPPEGYRLIRDDERETFPANLKYLSQFTGCWEDRQYHWGPLRETGVYAVPISPESPALVDGEVCEACGVGGLKIDDACPNCGLQVSDNAVAAPEPAASAPVMDGYVAVALGEPSLEGYLICPPNEGDQYLSLSQITARPDFGGLAFSDAAYIFSIYGDGAPCKYCNPSGILQDTWSEGCVVVRPSHVMLEDPQP